MFDTMACSSKLVEPMMIVGLLDALVEAPAVTAGTASVAARAVRIPAVRKRVRRMGGTFFVVGVPPDVW